MSNGSEGTRAVESRVPARMDRLPFSRWHWLVIATLGITWIRYLFSQDTMRLIEYPRKVLMATDGARASVKAAGVAVALADTKEGDG